MFRRDERATTGDEPDQVGSWRLGDPE